MGSINPLYWRRKLRRREANLICIRGFQEQEEGKL